MNPSKVTERVGRTREVHHFVTFEDGGLATLATDVSDTACEKPLHVQTKASLEIKNKAEILSAPITVIYTSPQS